MMNFKSFKNRELDINKPVEIYRCLNRKGKIFSVRQSGKVIGHTEYFVLTDCELVVNSAGKRRAVETQTRNVHAFIRGTWAGEEDVKLMFSYILSYNPFDSKGFVLKGAYLIPRNIPVIYRLEEQIYAQI